MENNPNIVDLRKVSIKDLVAYDVDMQLYMEFNDKFCSMNEHLGDIYSMKDIEELKECEKVRRKELIEEHINKIKELLEND